MAGNPRRQLFNIDALNLTDSFSANGSSSSNGDLNQVELQAHIAQESIYRSSPSQSFATLTPVTDFSSPGDCQPGCFNDSIQNALAYHASDEGKSEAHFSLACYHCL